MQSNINDIRYNVSIDWFGVDESIVQRQMDCIEQQLADINASKLPGQIRMYVRGIVPDGQKEADYVAAEDPTSRRVIGSRSSVDESFHDRTAHNHKSSTSFPQASRSTPSASPHRSPKTLLKPLGTTSLISFGSRSRESHYDRSDDRNAFSDSDPFYGAPFEDQFDTVFHGGETIDNSGDAPAPDNSEKISRTRKSKSQGKGNKVRAPSAGQSSMASLCEDLFNTPRMARRSDDVLEGEKTFKNSSTPISRNSRKSSEDLPESNDAPDEDDAASIASNDSADSPANLTSPAPSLSDIKASDSLIYHQKNRVKAKNRSSARKQRKKPSADRPTAKKARK
ncbi:uncharacterized protein LOC129586964 [Paramacrobiotus metropolitanus]|uniref:uncharacterized protein LOC129586964 n=1 Tax=Paramacrobiotus metropolitanus TaxID=2943436 RepID=UPI002445DBED|nr:uncharacterized protein LOC129586964 [Paramacrobiotus metropolitanus]